MAEVKRRILETWWSADPLSRTPQAPYAPPPGGGVVARLLILLLLASGGLVASATPDWTDCPASCRCKWISGKKTALCREAGYTAVPSTLNADIQVLDLTSNDISILPRDTFRSVGLLNLQRVYVRGARVREVHKDAFRDLTILVEVDLSENKITSLDPETFSGNDRLRVLILNGNPIRELQRMQFPPLPHLKTLEMRHCLLDYVHRDAFVNLVALETLSLANNKLKRLSEAVFLFSVRLKTLSLDGNPWRCDCELRAFRTWILSSKLYSLPLICVEPERLAERHWEDTRALDFACAPEVSLSEAMVQGEVGGNVTLSCLVKGDPEPEVRWLFGGRPLPPWAPLNDSAEDVDVSVDQVLLVEEETGLEKWTNLTISNLTETDAGDYACVAVNSGGIAAANVSLLLPEVVVSPTLSKAESWIVWAGILAGASVAGLGALSGAVVCACLCGRKTVLRKRSGGGKRKRKGQILTGSSSLTEQEKKLLDASSAERASAGASFDATSQTEMELLDVSRDMSTCELVDPQYIILPVQQQQQGPPPPQHPPQHQQHQQHQQHPPQQSQQSQQTQTMRPSHQPHVSQVPPPLHITIESHHGGPGIAESPMSHPAATASSGHFPGHLAGPFPARGPTLAPPPEFSSGLPTGAFGNIFISVSVSQDSDDPSAPQRYPDLLDIPRRSKKGAGGPGAAPGTAAPGAIPMDPNAAGAVATSASSSESSYPCHAPFYHQDLHCAAPPTHPKHGYGRPYAIPAPLQYAGDEPYTEECGEPDSRGPTIFATLPRRQRSKAMGVLEAGVSAAVVDAGPIVRVGPHYDNMGPRVTADGSSKLSLPEGTMSEEDDCGDEGSRGDDEPADGRASAGDSIIMEIPTPPPPPLVTNLPAEFVSL